MSVLTLHSVCGSFCAWVWVHTYFVSLCQVHQPLGNDTYINTLIPAETEITWFHRSNQREANMKDIWWSLDSFSPKQLSLSLQHIHKEIRVKGVFVLGHAALLFLLLPLPLPPSWHHFLQSPHFSLPSHNSLLFSWRSSEGFRQIFIYILVAGKQKWLFVFNVSQTMCVCVFIFERPQKSHTRAAITGIRPQCVALSQEHRLYSVQRWPHWPVYIQPLKLYNHKGFEPK